MQIHAVPHKGARMALRLLEAEEFKKKEIHEALVRGEKSRLEINVESKAHLKTLRGKLL